jgi:hypothetical protein
MLVTIQLKGRIDEALTQYRGCPILDADEDSVWIAVEADDVYTKYTYEEDTESYEFWGERGLTTVGTLDIKQCTYQGRRVLNADEVVEAIMESERHGEH